jgi:hypothetical protein
MAQADASSQLAPRGNFGVINASSGDLRMPGPSLAGGLRYAQAGPSRREFERQRGGAANQRRATAATTTAAITRPKGRNLEFRSARDGNGAASSEQGIRPGCGHGQTPRHRQWREIPCTRFDASKAVSDPEGCCDRAVEYHA